MNKRLGILLCGEHSPEAIKHYGDYTYDYRRMIESIMPNSWSLSVWRCYDGLFPLSTSECDAWIISGSNSSVTVPTEWMMDLEKFIEKLDKIQAVLIGFCFGHQIIHNALGGTVKPSNKGWNLGSNTFMAHSNSLQFQNIENGSIFFAHKDEVVNLAPDFCIIAKTSLCKSAITYKNNILTIQGHPEFSIEYFMFLCNNLRPHIGEKVFKHAINSIYEHNDSKIVIYKIIFYFLSKNTSQSSGDKK